ncbi:hypothetical protein MHU86_21505 [Fragilaria crotonensis]|nr:hypothetical protein MHU86_21505 [Fragilaria crotonensis]
MSIHQENPSKAEWRLWKKANRLWSTSSGNLDVPLGKWLQPHQLRRVELFAYHYRNRLAVRVMEGYVVCRKRSDGLFCETEKVIRYQEIPNDAVPATVEYEENLHWRVVHICEVFPTIHRMDWSTFSSFIDSLDPWEDDLVLRNTRMNVDPRLAVLELQNNFLAGSNGSSKFQTQGAFGWVVSTSSGERIATGNGPSRGATVDSYRAECSGLLAILRFLIRLAEYTDMVGMWSGRIGTDSQSLLDRAFEKHGENGHPLRYGVTSLKVLDVLDPEWDLLNKIQITVRRLPEVTLEYVKGHQDDHVEYSRLLLMAQLNVDADGLATLYQQEFGSTRPLVLLSDNAGAHLITHEGTVTSKLATTVRYLSTGPSLRQYIMKKNDWSEQIMRSINWLEGACKVPEK